MSSPTPEDDEVLEVEPVYGPPEVDGIPLADEELPPRPRPRLFEPSGSLPSVPPPEDRQVTLSGALLLVAAACALLAVVRLLSAPWVAAVLGLLCLLGILVMSFITTPRFELRIAWWVMLTLYLTACTAALFNISL